MVPPSIVETKLNACARTTRPYKHFLTQRYQSRLYTPSWRRPANKLCNPKAWRTKTNKKNKHPLPSLWRRTKPQPKQTWHDDREVRTILSPRIKSIRNRHVVLPLGALKFGGIYHKFKPPWLYDNPFSESTQILIPNPAWSCPQTLKISLKSPKGYRIVHHAGRLYSVIA